MGRHRGRATRWRMITAAVVVTVAAQLVAAPATHASGDRHGRLPHRYVVAETPGVLPEGIGLGPQSVFYVTSSGTGAVYRGNLDHPRLRLFAPPGAAGRSSALGVHVDPAGRVFVAGSTALDVYRPSGRLLAHRLAPPGAVGAASLNDLVITPNAVFVTDFANPTVLRATRDGDRIGPLIPWLDLSSVAPGLPAPYWFLNGIVAADDGRTLLVSSQGLGRLLRVDVHRRRAVEVDLGAVTFAADGLQLHGRTLYAVLNYQPPDGQGVYVVRLDAGLRTGRLVAAVTERDVALDSPTTLALVGSRLLVVNSQLDHPPGEPPYTVSVVSQRQLHPVLSPKASSTRRTPAR